jgi:hypothetical protein
MTKRNRPGALASNRAGENVLVGTSPLTTATLELQGNPIAPARIVAWQVDRWLCVSRVEVRHDR